MIDNCLCVCYARSPPARNSQTKLQGSNKESVEADAELRLAEMPSLYHLLHATEMFAVVLCILVILIILMYLGYYCKVSRKAKKCSTSGVNRENMNQVVASIQTAPVYRRDGSELPSYFEAVKT